MPWGGQQRLWLPATSCEERCPSRDKDVSRRGQAGCGASGDRRGAAWVPRSPRRAVPRGWRRKKERKRRWGQPQGDEDSLPPISRRGCHGGRLHPTPTSLCRRDCVPKRTVVILPPHPARARPGRREAGAHAGRRTDSAGCAETCPLRSVPHRRPGPGLRRPLLGEARSAASRWPHRRCGRKGPGPRGRGNVQGLGRGNVQGLGRGNLRAWTDLRRDSGPRGASAESARD